MTFSRQALLSPRAQALEFLGDPETRSQGLRTLPPLYSCSSSETDGARDFFHAGEKRTVAKDPKKFVRVAFTKCRHYQRRSGAR